MSYCNNSSNSKRWEFDYHFAVGYLPNHINANLFQSIKHTVQHYDQKTVSFLFLFSIYSETSFLWFEIFLERSNHQTQILVDG